MAVDSFAQAIPEDEGERIELIEAFREYVYYKAGLFLEDEDELLDEKVVRGWLDFSTKHLKKMSTPGLKSYFLKDEALNYIQVKSNYFYRLALKRLNGEPTGVKLSKWKAAKEVWRLERKLKEVKPYNAKTAKKYFSEGILDLNYVMDPKTNYTSLRLGHRICEKRGKEAEKS